MAMLNGFNPADHGDMQSFDALPPGDYTAVATDSEQKATKAGTGSYLQITWEVIEGEHKGRKFWSRLNLQNPNAQAVEIAQRELATICRATGVMAPRDSAEFHGKVIVLKIGTEVRKDTGEVTNKIKGYAPATGATQAARPAAPAASATSAGVKPPWRT